MLELLTEDEGKYWSCFCILRNCSQCNTFLTLAFVSSIATYYSMFGSVDSQPYSPIESGFASNEVISASREFKVTILIEDSVPLAWCLPNY
jgi:hypothetical protein